MVVGRRRCERSSERRVGSVPWARRAWIAAVVLATLAACRDDDNGSNVGSGLGDGDGGTGTKPNADAGEPEVSTPDATIDADSAEPDARPVESDARPDAPCADEDEDGVCGDDDNCADKPNADQHDADGDGAGDVCDDCPNDPDKRRPGACGCGQPEQVDPEICDGIDNNCDGVVDDGFVGLGDACSVGEGACERSGQRICKADGTDTLCDAVPGPTAPEICNGVDDDCDGHIDRSEAGEALTAACYSGPDVTVDVGQCRAGARTCADGVLGGCEGDVVPALEICDGLDNDCDGDVDEEAGGEPLHRVCYDGPDGTADVGVCSAGIQTCDEGAFAPCAGQALPGREICDRIDNNCDGSVDEGFDLETDLNHCGECGRGCELPNATAACVVGGCTLAACLAGFVDADGLDANGCEYACVPTGEEQCDGLDNDCDGQTDETEEGQRLSVACFEGAPATENVGPCRGGRQLCVDGALGPCDGQVLPSPEACNGVDDNCDGQVDEGDRDGDGFNDCVDECPDNPALNQQAACGCEGPDIDTDRDGHLDCVDNCPQVSNPDQADSDDDGMGDACSCPQGGFGLAPDCFLPDALYCADNPCWTVPPTGQESCCDVENCPGVAGQADCAGILGCGQDAQYPDPERVYWVLDPEPVEPPPDTNGFRPPQGAQDRDKAGDDEWTILDPLTGLLWMKHLPPLYDGCDRANGSQCEWVAAAGYCADLRYGGRRGWRLPTLHELLSIVSQRVDEGPAAVDDPFFPDTYADAGARYWSATPLAGNPGAVWAVSFETGATRVDITSAGAFVRCVQTQRAVAPDGEGTRFRISDAAPATGHRVVWDAITGLVWQAQVTDDGWGWNGALEYCEGMTYFGLDDWRLPNRNELVSLVDHGAADPASTFPSMPPQSFWSSTTVLGRCRSTWAINFGHGEVEEISLAGQNDEVGARCVRDGPMPAVPVGPGEVVPPFP